MRIFALLRDLDVVSRNGRANYDVIGFQSHFTSDSLPAIDRIMAELDRYKIFDRYFHVTEFDIDSVFIDRQTQADFARDFFSTLEANENVTATTIWGFWESEHWRASEGADLFDTNGSVLPIGQWLIDQRAELKRPVQATARADGIVRMNVSAGMVTVRVAGSDAVYQFDPQTEPFATITI